MDRALHRRAHDSDGRRADRPTLSAMPPRYAPMLATDASELPAGDGWAFEIKWDGVRAMAEVEAGAAVLRNRRGGLITDRYPELEPLGAALAPALGRARRRDRRHRPPRAARASSCCSGGWASPTR